MFCASMMIESCERSCHVMWIETTVFLLRILIPSTRSGIDTASICPPLTPAIRLQEMRRWHHWIMGAFHFLILTVYCPFKKRCNSLWLFLCLWLPFFGPWPGGLLRLSQLNIVYNYRRKFRSQTSDNMDRWKAEQERGREKRKIRRQKSRRERVRRKKMQMREKVGKSRNTVFFPMICGSGGSKK